MVRSSMMPSAPSNSLLPPARTYEPVWDIAKLFPYQGQWSESDYLKLNGNYFVEFSHGHVEVLPMPIIGTSSCSSLIASARL